MVNVFWADGSEVQKLIKSYAGNITLMLREFKAGSGSVVQTVKRYTPLGIREVVPFFDQYNIPLLISSLFTARFVNYHIQIYHSPSSSKYAPERPSREQDQKGSDQI